MEPGFFSSRHFLIAAAIAALLLGGAAAGYVLAPDSIVGDSSAACARPQIDGAPLNATRTESSDGDTRTIHYSFDAAGLDGGRIVACMGVGDIDVVQAEGAQARVTITITGDAPAISATQVVAALARAPDGGLVVAAWESRSGEARNLFFSHRSAHVVMRIEVPPTGPFDVATESHVGDTTVHDLLVGNLSLTSDVGDITIRGTVDVQGNVTLTSNVGDVDARLASLSTSRLRVDTDVGDVTLHLPSRADLGYDLTARADVGSVDVNVGPTENTSHTKDGAGESFSARTAGFASKPAQVLVGITANVGSITVVASA